MLRVGDSFMYEDRLSDERSYIAIVVNIDPTYNIQRGAEELSYPGWVDYLIRGQIVGRPLCLIENHIREGKLTLWSLNDSSIS